MNAKAAELRTLIVAPVGRDAAALAASLIQSGLDARACADLGHCSRELAAGAGCLLITEEGLATPTVDALIQTLDAQASWSALPIVVLTAGAVDVRLDLLDRLGLSVGVVTLLERPLSQARLVGAVRVALNARRRQYQVRTLLAERALREQMLRE
ncbi:MAG: hybrid sensor histidine kinase/response regulator, partial [Pseudomonadales bacterium]